MDRWVGKVAVVTGASAGIGAAIVEELLKHEVIVVGLARRVELIEQIKNGLEPGQAKNLHCLKCDISKVEKVVEAFQWIKENLKTVHILVNNAGATSESTLIGGPFELWKTVIDVNVLGLCACTKEAIQLMKATGVQDGHIIHINSVTGHKVQSLGPDVPVPYNVYGGSKFAVTALTETLRLELNFAKMKTKVTSISPGFVNTDTSEEDEADPSNKLFEMMPFLEAKDIADAVIYVLGTPPNVQVHELTIKPVNESF